MENTVAQPNPNQANGILENATIAVPLTNLTKFGSKCHWLISKFYWNLDGEKLCVLSAFSVANDDDVGANSSNIGFTIKSTKLYVSVVTLSGKENKKLSKGLKDQCNGMNLK